MSVSITDNTPQVTADIMSKLPIALRLMLDDIDRISEPKTPMDKGDLRRNKLKQVLGLHAVIQWRQRYAEVQEAGTWKTGKNAGKIITHYTTAGTGPHYAENAVKQVVEDASLYFGRAGL